MAILLTSIIIGVIILICFAILILKRRARWYRVYLLKDYRNPTSGPKSYWLSTRVQEGIEVADIWNHIYSFKSVNAKERPIIEKPDLNAFAFFKMLYAVRGNSKKPGDATWRFFSIPMMSEDDIKDFDEKVLKLTQTAMGPGVFDKLTAEEKQKRIAQLNEDIKALGLLAKSSSDPLLREEKVAYAAINADSANYIMQNMTKWQKISMMAIPVLLLIAIFVNGLVGYLLYQSYTTAQATTFTYQNQLVQEMNANNQYFYSVITSLNIYGVRAPVNYTTPPIPSGGTIIPSVSVIPKTSG